jgi:methylglyoxal synthase
VPVATNLATAELVLDGLVDRLEGDAERAAG